MSGADDIQVIRSSRSSLILRRLAVVGGVLLVLGALIAVRLFVHVHAKTDWAVLCIPTVANVTEPPSVTDSTALYPNVTLAPCNLTTTVHLPPTMWAAYVHN